LTFADARAGTDLTSFFDMNQAARSYGTVAAKVGAAFFINDKTPPTDPDDD
jgi:hypothetical protein